MTNIELLKYSQEHLVPLIDSYYNKDKIVITPTREEKNALMCANAQLIELITVFNYLRNEDRGEADADIQVLIKKVMTILDKTYGINFSAFSQFFMVYNSAHSSYMTYSEEKKRRFIYEMLCRFCNERHSMYMSHGYSDSILQVMCDNYSHKRNSKTTIDKITDVIEPLGFIRGEREELIQNQNRSYLLPDKGDTDRWNHLVSSLGLELKALKQEQDKLPDFVLKESSDYYIGEAKMMKGSGGGQDKQLVEIINFIRYAEQDSHIHYVTYLDGEYANMLFAERRTPKIQRQFDDLVRCLRDNPNNYFVNPAGFEQLLAQICANL